MFKHVKLCELIDVFDEYCTQRAITSQKCMMNLLDNIEVVLGNPGIRIRCYIGSIRVRSGLNTSSFSTRVILLLVEGVCGCGCGGLTCPYDSSRGVAGGSVDAPAGGELRLEGHQRGEGRPLPDLHLAAQGPEPHRHPPSEKARLVRALPPQVRALCAILGTYSLSYVIYIYIVFLFLF